MVHKTQNIYTANGALDLLAIERNAKTMRAEATRAFFANLFESLKRTPQTPDGAQNA